VTFNWPFQLDTVLAIIKAVGTCSRGYKTQLFGSATAQDWAWLCEGLCYQHKSTINI